MHVFDIAYELNCLHVYIIGPGTVKGIQVGIVSYGATDCTLAKPSILARVTDNWDFIKATLVEVSSSSTMRI